MLYQPCTLSNGTVCVGHLQPTPLFQNSSNCKSFHMKNEWNLQTIKRAFCYVFCGANKGDHVVQSNVPRDRCANCHDCVFEIDIKCLNAIKAKMSGVLQSNDKSSRMKRNNSTLAIFHFIVNFFLFVSFVSFVHSHIVISRILVSVL